MRIRQIDIPFENQMRRVQTVLGWIYIPVHMVVLPLLLGLYVAFSPTPLTGAQIELIDAGFNLLFVLCVMLPYLRRSFDALLDRIRLCFLTILVALLVYYALSNFISLFQLLLGGMTENPNDNAIMEQASNYSGIMRATGIFIAPLVEEVLYRGVVFGSIRTRSRGWAYAVSVALFALAHVWQYALVYRDPSLLLYAIQYIPFAVAATWAYERSGSIWPSVFLHMGNNALSFYLMSLI